MKLLLQVLDDTKVIVRIIDQLYIVKKHYD